jgi:NAD(P) transhydrogenase subunit alpha
MAQGSVIVDLAAERGGNCDITEPDQVVVKHGVTIMGPINLASGVPYHASMMYARNVTAFVTHLIKDQKLNLNLSDQIVSDTVLTNQGEIVQERVREFLGLPSFAKQGG